MARCRACFGDDGHCRGSDLYDGAGTPAASMGCMDVGYRLCGAGVDHIDLVRRLDGVAGSGIRPCQRRSGIRHGGC